MHNKNASKALGPFRMASKPSAEKIADNETFLRLICPSLIVWQKCIELSDEGRQWRPGRPPLHIRANCPFPLENLIPNPFCPESVSLLTMQVVMDLTSPFQVIFQSLVEI